MNNNELLYSVFETHLYHGEKVHQTIQDFVYEVVQEYLRLLQAKGILIPFKLRPVLELDLQEDVDEMVRKKTYGHFDLTEFRAKNSALIDQLKRRPS